MDKRWGGSTRKLQESVIEKMDSPVSESKETHPAYAMIGVSRVSGHAHLYGSDFAHQHYMTVTIRASELMRSLSRDWPLGREDYIEVALSEAQWASFVSSPNAGQGVQCTLLFRQGEGQIPAIARPKDRTEQFSGEVRKNLQDAQKALADLRDRILAGKGGKESLRLLDQVVREIGSSTDFVASQFVEHMEHVVEHAKVEVNAYAQATITRLGLQAVTEMPLALDNGEE